MNIGRDVACMLLQSHVRGHTEASWQRGAGAHQLVATAQCGNDGKMRRRRQKEVAEMGKKLTEVALRCEVDAHGHVVKYDEGEEGRRNLKAGGA